MKPITIDLSGLSQQFGVAKQQIAMLTETCVSAVAAAVYANWEALAKQTLGSTRPEYLRNLNQIDKGQFEKQIVLTGVLPNMLEQGASAFDMKAGFQRSDKVKYTVAKYNAKGAQISPGGDWYLTIPFRLGTPGIVGQAGFSGELPQEVYDIVVKRKAGHIVTESELPNPYNIPQTRREIQGKDGSVLYKAYQHRNAVYAGLAKRQGVYQGTTQNYYGTFRRAGANSDPMSWIHRGLEALHLADKAIEKTDVETIVNNEVIDYLEAIL